METTWLTGLLAAAIAVQIVVPTGAAAGYDLSKWASVNYLPGSAGYFKIARQQAIHDPWKCAVMRATQAFQPLGLIFLQLEKDSPDDKYINPDSRPFRSSVQLRARLRITVLLAQ